jgi:peptide chain release factor 1
MDAKTLEKLEERLGEVVTRYHEIETQMSQPEIASDMEKSRQLAKQHADMAPVVSQFTQYKELKTQLAEAKEMLDGEDDPEMMELAQASLEEANTAIPKLVQELQVHLLPKDPMDDKNVIVEIRAGTGGEEAGLFAGDLFRMYSRYSEAKGWKQELLESSPTDKGGFREVIFSISGDRVYSNMKWESGVHRVQRVPETEASGRIHTSAATVAVLPEAEDVDVQVDPNDLQIDVYRSSGPGGQSVNTTDSAVRITHKPSGLVVTCQDEKSQIKNKAKALRVLRSRLLDLEQQKQAQERAGERKAMVGSGDRSERIRTYNFPQNRLTDHRINLTLYSLDRIVEGDLDELIKSLAMEDQAKQLSASNL